MKPDEQSEPQKRNWRRWFARSLIVVLALPIGGELVARFYLGLGDPPLYVADPRIEYLFKPSQTCRRFGNHIHYNAYSMRSEDFPPHKSSPDELRVLVFGDSVVNGGALTDDSQLATKLLESDLSHDLKRPVTVGNISAASWGPPNLLAYAQRFGLLDADVVVIVLSSHDYADVPTFKPVVDVDPGYPGKPPWCALSEGISRYLLPRFSHSAATDSGAPDISETPPQKDIDESLSALRSLIDLARSRGAKVILAQHLEAAEPVGNEKPGHAMIEQAGRDAGVPIVQFGPAFDDARSRGENPWRDIIHPSAIGQRLMADLLKPQIEAALADSTTRPSTLLDSAPFNR